MLHTDEKKCIQQQYISYMENKDFACIGAKAALAKGQYIVSLLIIWLAQKMIRIF